VCTAQIWRATSGDGTDNNGSLHIRIFDAAGNRITDTDEGQLPAQAKAIAKLKQQLPDLLPPHVLTDAEKAQFIANVTSIVGQINYPNPWLTVEADRVVNLTVWNVAHKAVELSYVTQVDFENTQLINDKTEAIPTGKYQPAVTYGFGLFEANAAADIHYHNSIVQGFGVGVLTVPTGNDNRINGGGSIFKNKIDIAITTDRGGFAFVEPTQWQKRQALTIAGVSLLGTKKIALLPGQLPLDNDASTSDSDPTATTLRLSGFDLRLISWGDATPGPSPGKGQVIVGTDNVGLLHVKIIDADGSTVTDTDETMLPTIRADAIKNLKNELRRFSGFDLQLMSWGDGSGVPTSGKSLVVVGTDNDGLLHIRILDAAGVRTDTFEEKDSDVLHLKTTDASGTVLSDELESSLPQATAITNLKQQLPRLLPPYMPTSAEKAQVISETTSIFTPTLLTEVTSILVPLSNPFKHLFALTDIELQGVKLVQDKPRGGKTRETETGRLFFDQQLQHEIPLPYFDLRLMSWGDGSGVPATGRSLIVVGTDNNRLLHIRIFDAAGVRTDTYEAMQGGELHLKTADATGTVLSNELESSLPPTRAGAITNLKKQLPGLLPPHVPTSAEKAQVISETASIVGQTPPLQVLVEKELERQGISMTSQNFVDALEFFKRLSGKTNGKLSTRAGAPGMFAYAGAVLHAGTSVGKVDGIDGHLVASNDSRITNVRPPEEDVL
jgi:hypothetical protein